MNVNRAVNLDDLRLMAQKRLPKIAFDFIEGGVDDEISLWHNREVFKRHKLLPRYLVDVSKREQKCVLLGQSYAYPFGISPMGVIGLFRPNADLMLAEAAKIANIPYIMSSASNASIEAAAKTAPKNTWFQIYATSKPEITEDLVRRARDLALTTLVVTIDVPVYSNRERNRRNGFARPLKMSPSIVLEALRHPGWLFDFIRTGGIPLMENWAPYAPKGASSGDVADLYGMLTPAPMITWSTIERIRSLWSGNLVIKGILHPDDAIRAANLGAEAIIVSNHGGRQLDPAPSPLELLPSIHAAVGERVELILESGVRRGSDVIIALCLGARFVLFGRPALYGAAAGGAAGVSRAIEIMRKEIDVVMAQIGCSSIKELGPHYLWEEL
ncbi:(S)-mandelate dehydrogenase [Bradyrhizobium japonicum]